MKRFFEDARKYYDYEVRAAKSVLKTEVANSYLNWIWWVLDPILTMVTYYIVFGIIFQRKEPNFPVFLVIGLTVWDFFNKNVQQGVSLIQKNKSIIGKVYLPKFVLLFTNMMINGFKMMVSWGIIVIMMIATKVEPSWYMLAYFPIMLVLFLLTFALAVNMMHFGVFIEDLSMAISHLLKVVYYMTGIFYSIENRVGHSHPRIAKILVNCNPMAMLVTDMRNVLIYQKAPNWTGLLVWAGISLVLAVIGIRRLYKYENSYVKVI